MRIELAAAWLCLLGYLVGLSMVPSAVAAHPFHISTAELEYNSKSNCFEVGLKLQGTDLEQALKHLAGKRLDIEKSSADELIAKYLSENFYFAMRETVEANEINVISEPRATASEKQPLLALPPPRHDSVKLIGKEFETSWVWLYFEIKAPALEKPWLLVNRVLMDVNSGQINTCTIRFHGQRQALKMTAARPAFEVDRQWLRVAIPK